jgi:hypothetical protein
MTIAAHNLEAWLGTTQLGVIDAQITLDESWNPYAQASVTLPLKEELIDQLDPRTGARISLYATQSYGVSDKLSSLTATYGGGTIADITAVWTGQTIGNLSAWYFVPYNASGSNTFATLTSLYGGGTIADLTDAWEGLYFWEISELYSRSYPSGIFNNARRQFDLTIRSRRININEATIVLTLESNEALLQDLCLVQDINFSPATTDLRTIVKGVLARIGDGLVAGTATATVTADATIWAPGQTAWDYLTPMLKQAGLRLFCDERRRWYLVEDTYVADGIVELFSNETITNAAEEISRDDDSWYDSVVIKYTWVNDLKETIVSYDTAGVENYQKTKLIEINSLNPGLGAAQRILERALSRGITKDVTAVANYRLTPSTACNIYITGYPKEEGYVRSVAWNFPADTMTVNTRRPTEN